LRADVLVPAFAGQDVVISCLGHRSRHHPTLLRDASAGALDAMARAGVRRYLAVSQGLLFPERHLMFRLLRFILSRQLADSSAMESLVRASAVDWTIVRPPRLTDGTTPRGYRAEVDAWPRGGWSMRRTDLAAFVLDVAERRTYARAIVGLAS
jgi:putative NADH-flavin reductase